MKYLAKAATLDYDAGKCTGCRMCVEVCPHQVFVIENRRARITDTDRCMECGACALNCEAGAISVDAGVGCASAIINGMLTGGEPTCGCDSGESGGSSSCC
ncbi:MAG: mercury methylation ferredoxin HgcB [Thermoleophilia bacterium]